VEVIASGGYYGMQTFDQALFGHVKAGRVTFEDAMRWRRARTTSSC
jgi:twitching motility protein PilT